MGFGSSRHAYPVTNTEHHHSPPKCHPISDSNSYSSGYCYCHRCRHGHSDSDGYSYCNRYCSRHGYFYRHGYCDSYGHSHGNGNAYALADLNPAAYT